MPLLSHGLNPGQVGGIPVDPATRAAREWLERELAKPDYHASPSLTERLRDWLLELLGRTGGAGLPSWVVPLALVVVLAVIGLVLWRVLRRDPAPSLATSPGAVLDGVDATATELRDRAGRALAAGDAEAALVDGYRAVVARAIERVLLQDLPGRTAHEAARDLAPAFPDDAAELHAAADEFDGVRYGERPTTIDTAREVIALADRLSAARPHLTSGLPGTESGVGASW